jgi:phospholipase/carboxylesterase
MQIDPETLKIEEWVLKVRHPASGPPRRIVLMLHGWTGDENVMWIFASRLPEDALLVAPRAIHAASTGGYSWHPRREDAWPHIDEFQPAVDSLLALLPKLASRLEMETNGKLTENFDLVGFSQGAALSYTLALLHPERVGRVAGLAGFVPEGAQRLAEARPLAGKKLFAAHGTQDNLVDVERARRGIAILEQAGAQVVYCEDEVGHKLSLTCFKGLEAYFKY